MHIVKMWYYGAHLWQRRQLLSLIPDGQLLSPHPPRREAADHLSRGFLQGQMLAALLQWPQATFASKVELDKAAGKVKVSRRQLLQPQHVLNPSAPTSTDRLQETSPGNVESHSSAAHTSCQGLF
jgi:hypothetical protein